MAIDPSRFFVGVSAWVAVLEEGLLVVRCALISIDEMHKGLDLRLWKIRKIPTKIPIEIGF